MEQAQKSAHDSDIRHAYSPMERKVKAAILFDGSLTSASLLQLLRQYCRPLLQPGRCLELALPR